MSVSIALILSKGRRKCAVCDRPIAKGDRLLFIQTGTYRETVSVNICMLCIRMFAVRHLEKSVKERHQVEEWEKAAGIQGFNGDGSELLSGKGAL